MTASTFKKPTNTGAKASAIKSAAWPGLARQGLCDAGGGNARLLQSAEDEIRQGGKHPLHRGVGITAAKACQGLPDALYQTGAEQGVKHPLGGGASQQARQAGCHHSP